MIIGKIEQLTTSNSGWEHTEKLNLHKKNTDEATIEILEILKQLPKEAKVELLKNIQMYKIGYKDGVKSTLAQMQKSPQQVTV